MGLMDKLKSMIGVEDDYYDEDYNDDYYNDSDETARSEAPSYEEKRAESIINEVKRDDVRSSRSSNVVNMAVAMSGKMKICIQEPLTYDDGRGVIDNITAGRTVVLNLEMLEVDKKRQIFDFVSGGVYALKGSLEKVTKDIYVLVPKGVEVDGKIADTVANKSLYQI